MKETDIVVYDGIISTASIFWSLGIGVGDACMTDLKLSTKEEIDLYNKRPEQ